MRKNKGCAIGSIVSNWVCKWVVTVPIVTQGLIVPHQPGEMTVQQQGRKTHADSAELPE